ncbi:hypothetical protein C8R46DRAFT_1353669 [Mycena filopes]|nr:hypothetical protein C8R46DRAFT_1353669 [Mycena filopes]
MNFIALALLLASSHSPTGASILLGLEQRASQCCTSLNTQLPGTVIFPSDPSFASLLQRYYSAEERAIASACRFNPTSARDVSVAIDIVVKVNCQFAVVSGGHMFWPGAANIGAPGITIDMRLINTVSLSSDHAIAHVGPGSNWVPVYDLLSQFNRTAVGARSNTVGVGGFLLGGGISNLSPQHGFANDNIVNYQIVLANGQIADCNLTSNPDLFWALKAGSTNFGLITRYDILTYPGGIMSAISDALIAFMRKLQEFPLGGASVISGSSNGNDFLVAGFAYNGADGSTTELFSDMLAVPGVISDTLRSNVNQVNISAEIDAAFPPGMRTRWGTMTFRANTQLALDISAQGRVMFSPFIDHPGFSFNVGYQSLPAPMLAASHSKDNAQGLTDGDGDLFLLNVFVYWADTSDDAALNTTIRELISFATTEAQSRGLWNPWLYVNYAFPGEAVYPGYGADNLARLKATQALYDPNGVFQTLWSGGFKL